MNILIESAVKLEKEQEEKILAVLNKKFGNDISADFKVDNDLIGGLRVTINGSERIDLSVRGRLSQIEKLL
ncbi:MAG TPA: F0F1 ATP synthase subunit delta [Patescibacteria group bacterium]|nr:F0F1 ATP synthase subunit delta [Patescibacteria group bacterium]